MLTWSQIKGERGGGGLLVNSLLNMIVKPRNMFAARKRGGRIRPCYVPVKPYEKKIIFQGSWGTLLQNHADKV